MGKMNSKIFIGRGFLMTYTLSHLIEIVKAEIKDSFESGALSKKDYKSLSNKLEDNDPIKALRILFGLQIINELTNLKDQTKPQNKKNK